MLVSNIKERKLLQARAHVRPDSVSCVLLFKASPSSEKNTVEEFDHKSRRDESCSEVLTPPPPLIYGTPYDS